MSQAVQMGIFEAPRRTRTPKPFTPHEASRRADESIQSSKAAICEKILRYIAQQPNGSTCDEVEQALALRHQTCSARFTELRDAGKLTAADKRPTQSGRMAVAYRVVA